MNRDARARILTRVYATRPALPADTSGVSEYLAARPRGPQPWLPGDLRACFLTRLNAAGASATVVPRRADLPAAVTDHLSRCRWPHALVLADHPLLIGLPWPAQVERRNLRPSDATALTWAFAGVAETGSLVLIAAPSSPSAMNFLPENFLCVLPEAHLLPHLEDIWERLRDERTVLPRAVNLIPGPSRTGDVEQTIQLGAHGPRRLHVWLLENLD
jgi:L-lactate dehydrogenase complex protein LldG